MNERIKELADKARFTDKVPYPSQDEVLQKFAELIVEECAGLAGCNGHVSGFSLGDLMRQHFGLKD